ncbi:MAG TPA: helix-turn-helix domain-containing protein [Candidatus Saccharimonadales bacterium]|nr:helix-turn-helix domain-containing protein [Candidatus Saccharimonadales bacterium]
MSRARTVLNRAVLVTDERGVVITGESVGAIMVDALRACQEGRIVRSVLGDDQIAWCPFVYETRTVGAFGVIEESVQVTPEAISLLQGLAEVITHQHFLMEHVQPTEKMRASFLKQVLSSNKLEPTETFRQADILQMNLRTPQAIMIAQVDGLEKTALGSDAEALSLDEQGVRLTAETNAVQAVINEALGSDSGNISCYLSHNQFVISKGIGGEGLTTRNTTRYLREKATYLHDVLVAALPKRTVSIGAGQYYPDLGGLRKSYQEAKLSLQVGTKVWGAGRVYHIKQVGMFVTLANVAQERKAELAHQILHPLLSDEQLFKTVQTFLTAGLNLTEAAEKLHVHRNTLIYRLDKTKKIIGLDPRVFDDALQIKLGLMFYQEAAA